MAGVIVIPCIVQALVVAGIKFVGFPSQNLYMDFHKIFRICLPQRDLKLIMLWGVSAITVAALATLSRFLGLIGSSFWVFHSLNPCMYFHHICLLQEDLELHRFLGVSGNICCHGNTFKILGS